MLTAFVFGDAVLDAVLGVSRAKRVAVWFEHTAKPTRSQVLSCVGADLPIDWQVSPPNLHFDFQRLVLDLDGLLFDRVWNDYRQQSLVLSAELLDFNLTATSLVEGCRILATYPEITVPPLVRRRLRADMALLSEMAVTSPDLANLLEGVEWSD